MTARLDKWLWAARFFRTRSLATQAVNGGKVKLNDAAVKPGRGVVVGDKLTVRVGVHVYEIVVHAVTDKRGPSKEAVALYEETQESRSARETLAQQMSEDAKRRRQTRGRPTKRERRQIDKFKEL